MEEDPGTQSLGADPGETLVCGESRARFQHPILPTLQPTPIGTVHTDLPAQTQPRDKAQLYSKNQVRCQAKDASSPVGVEISAHMTLLLPTHPGAELYQRGAECG